MKLNSDYSVIGSTRGWYSIDFDTTNGNIMISGIIKDTSQTYTSIMSLDYDLTTVNWMKYFAQTSSSTLNLTFDEIVTHYDSASDSVLAILQSINNSTSYYNMINIFKISTLDGSVEWSIQFRDYSGNNFGWVKSTINPFYNELVLFYTNNEYKYYHAQAIDIDDGSFKHNIQIAIFKHYVISGIAIYPLQTTEQDIEDILMTAIDGYIMKINMRKANLDIIDTESWDRPLYSINYDSFSLLLESPSDIELLSYSPDSDFFEVETDYEITSRSYTYFYETIPTLTDATDLMIYFNDTYDIVSVPNTGSFKLSRAHTKDYLRDDFITVTLQIYSSTE